MPGLFDNYYFDPSSYGSAQGLLSQLMNGGQSAGNDQPSPLDNAQWPAGPMAPLAPDYGQTSTVQIGSGPNAYSLPIFGSAPAQDPAALPPNAQPATGQFPQMAQTQEPSILDRLGAGFQGFGAGGRTGGLFGALAGGAEGLSSGVSPQNQTVNALVAHGLDPQLASSVARDPSLLRAVLPSLVKKAAGATEYGLTPVYGTDAQGKAVIGTLGKDGTFKTVDTKGVSISTGVDKIDLGTQFAIYDKKSGNLIGYQPKDLRGAAREKGIGEAQGSAVASAPADIQAGQNAIDILGKIKKNPYLEQGTGLSSLGNIIPGTGGYDFNNMVEQAKSGAFLQAIQQMRGLGSLSNAEGGAATAAITRMNVATSKEAFLDALGDYEKIVKQGMERARGRLANPSATNPAPVSDAPAAKPSVDDLLKKYGGQ